MENTSHSIEPDISLILQQINNPLTKIHLCLEILHNLHNDAESQHFYNMIKDSAHDIHTKVRTIALSINAPAAHQPNDKQ